MPQIIMRQPFIMIFYLFHYLFWRFFCKNSGILMPPVSVVLLMGGFACWTGWLTGLRSGSVLYVLGGMYELCPGLLNILCICDEEEDAVLLKNSGVLTSSLGFELSPVAITVIDAVSGVVSSYMAPKIIFAESPANS